MHKHQNQRFQKILARLHGREMFFSDDDDAVGLRHRLIRDIEYHKMPNMLQELFEPYAVNVLRMANGKSQILSQILVFLKGVERSLVHI